MDKGWLCEFEAYIVSTVVYTPHKVSLDSQHLRFKTSVAMQVLTYTVMHEVFCGSQAVYIPCLK